MGVPARRIERAGDIAGTVEANIEAGGPSLIDVHIGG
jgi:benzoylformate decarboxylase